MPSPQAYVRKTFEAAWRLVQEQMSDDLMNPDDVAFRWWPTIKGQDPNWDVLVENFMGYPLSPYLAMLAVYWYGYAQGLEEVDQERVIPQPRGRERLPRWMEELALEDLAKRFADKH